MAKTIFNTSENSNFILNMTEEKYSSIASKALTAVCLIVSLFTIPAECFEGVSFPIISGGLAIGGVICLILALIAAVKKYIKKGMLFPICAFGIMLVWGIISMINSYSIQVSFYGFDGRGEGLLALTFYFGFFLTGMSIKQKKSLNFLLGGIIAAGLLNSIWALLQIFIKSVPDSFRYVAFAGEIRAASGLAQSPIFLAMLLSLSLTAALVSFVTSANKKIRIVCLLSACIFSFVMTATYTLMGICGMVLAVISTAAAVIITKAPVVRLAGTVSVIIPAVLSAVLISAGIIGDTNQYRLCDGPIMWSDSYFRLSASGNVNPKALDINDTADVYYFLNSKTAGIIERFPLTGTGPEQLVYPQLYSSAVIDKNIGTFDKNYNEYLYTAATRGIPSMLALIAVIISILCVGRKKLKANSPEGVCLFMVTATGVLLFFIGCSNITFSPVFWAAAGALCSSSSQKPECAEY